MCMTTYLSDSDKSHFQATLFDRDIKEALRDLNRLDGGSWLVRQTKHNVRKWFGSKEIYLFSLHHDCHSGVEYQVINFAPNDEGDSSINSSASKQAVLAYIYGVLAGLGRIAAATA